MLWRLRKLLEVPPLKHGELIACDRRGAVALHREAPVELDVDEFARRVLPALAKPLERMGETDVEALRAGIELYTADILTDIGDEWVLRDRENHRRHYLNALGRPMQICTLARDHAASIRHAQAILDHDALRENVHRELMRLFLQSGQRALALRQFELCCDRAARRERIAPGAQDQVGSRGRRRCQDTELDPGLWQEGVRLPSGDLVMRCDELKHLHPGVRDLALLGDAERIGPLQRERWIDYPRAGEALGRLLRLLRTPERQRMPCMMLHGPSNIGKTLIIAKFLREHPPVFDERRGVERREVIAMQMPPTPDQARFYRALLFELGVPQAARTIRWPAATASSARR